MLAHKDLCSLICNPLLVLLLLLWCYATLVSFSFWKVSVFTIRSNQRHFISHPYYIYLVCMTWTPFCCCCCYSIFHLIFVAATVTVAVVFPLLSWLTSLFGWIQCLCVCVCGMRDSVLVIEKKPTSNSFYHYSHCHRYHRWFFFGPEQEKLFFMRYLARQKPNRYS